ncbi:phosphotransferase family protein [Oceanobacillus kapialis]|uniref:Phosphotransferase family protein n=1 Tax=Oceanobacillus kapialis TaxID=481353 RepID=A0ABW5Q3R9_9BACI
MEKILNQLNLGNISLYEKVTGGRDSVVFKVQNINGKTYAIRILPKERVEQFRQEAQLMEVATNNGIPVPAVQEVKVVDDHAVMIMNWGKGRTVLEELLASPENAIKLGRNFGRMQRRLHDVMPSHLGQSKWLEPQNKQEKELYKKATLANDEEKVRFLHMDYHPLNVLAEKNKIAGVLDWVNASTGDYRFDLARTYSILTGEEARKYLGINKSVIMNFSEAWLDGYYMDRKERDNFDLFLEWAKLRLSRELAVNSIS